MEELNNRIKENLNNLEYYNNKNKPINLNIISNNSNFIDVLNFDDSFVSNIDNDLNKLKLTLGLKGDDSEVKLLFKENEFVTIFDKFVTTKNLEIYNETEYHNFLAKKDDEVKLIIEKKSREEISILNIEIPKGNDYFKYIVNNNIRAKSYLNKFKIVIESIKEKYNILDTLDIDIDSDQITLEKINYEEKYIDNLLTQISEKTNVAIDIIKKEFTDKYPDIFDTITPEDLNYPSYNVKNNLYNKFLPMNKDIIIDTITIDDTSEKMLKFQNLNNIVITNDNIKKIINMIDRITKLKEHYKYIINRFQNLNYEYNTNLNKYKLNNVVFDNDNNFFDLEYINSINNKINDLDISNIYDLLAINITDTNFNELKQDNKINAPELTYEQFYEIFVDIKTNVKDRFFKQEFLDKYNDKFNNLDDIINYYVSLDDTVNIPINYYYFLVGLNFLDTEEDRNYTNLLKNMEKKKLTPEEGLIFKAIYKEKIYLEELYEKLNNNFVKINKIHDNEIYNYKIQQKLIVDILKKNNIINEKILINFINDNYYKNGIDNKSILFNLYKTEALKKIYYNEGKLTDINIDTEHYNDLNNNDIYELKLINSNYDKNYYNTLIEKLENFNADISTLRENKDVVYLNSYVLKKKKLLKIVLYFMKNNFMLIKFGLISYLRFNNSKDNYELSLYDVLNGKFIKTLNLKNEFFNLDISYLNNNIIDVIKNRKYNFNYNFKNENFEILIETEYKENTKQLITEKEIKNLKLDYNLGDNEDRYNFISKVTINKSINDYVLKLQQILINKQNFIDKIIEKCLIVLSLEGAEKDKLCFEIKNYYVLLLFLWNNFEYIINQLNINYCFNLKNLNINFNTVNLLITDIRKDFIDLKELYKNNNIKYNNNCFHNIYKSLLTIEGSDIEFIKNHFYFFIHTNPFDTFNDTKINEYIKIKENCFIFNKDENIKSIDNINKIYNKDINKINCYELTGDLKKTSDYYELDDYEQFRYSILTINFDETNNIEIKIINDLEYKFKFNSELINIKTKHDSLSFKLNSIIYPFTNCKNYIFNINNMWNFDLQINSNYIDIYDLFNKDEEIIQKDNHLLNNLHNNYNKLMGYDEKKLLNKILNTIDEKNNIIEHDLTFESRNLKDIIEAGKPQGSEEDAEQVIKRKYLYLENCKITIHYIEKDGYKNKLVYDFKEYEEQEDKSEINYIKDFTGNNFSKIYEVTIGTEILKLYKRIFIEINYIDLYSKFIKEQAFEEILNYTNNNLDESKYTLKYVNTMIDSNNINYYSPFIINNNDKEILNFKYEIFNKMIDNNYNYHNDSYFSISNNDNLFSKVLNEKLDNLIDINKYNNDDKIFIELVKNIKKNVNIEII